jgi:hypothetical protein
MDKLENDKICSEDCKHYQSYVAFNVKGERCKKGFTLEIGLPCAYYEKRRDSLKKLKSQTV